MFFDLASEYKNPQVSCTVRNGEYDLLSDFLPTETIRGLVQRILGATNNTLRQIFVSLSFHLFLSHGSSNVIGFFVLQNSCICIKLSYWSVL